ncbi:hypothetical protein TNCV_1851921 [Trichonephila clavipes]|nr:hypothetical protein TNCV_1851921 [Trichonephila clavipes]
MAGEAVSLHIACRPIGMVNLTAMNFEADDFPRVVPVDLYKRLAREFLGLFTPSYVCQKTSPVRKRALRYPMSPLRQLSPLISD